MAFFAQPLALFALGALTVPVLMYLLRRPRRVVRVGSLRPLDAQRSPPALRWQPRWLILALRCALLATLALMLADPLVRPAPLGQVRWVLRAPDVVLGTADQAAWDAALRSGWQPHWLAPGFEAFRADSPVGATADTWSLLTELDARVAAGSTALVFAPTTANHFSGERPTLSRLRVTWQPLTAPPSLSGAAAPATFWVLAPPERAAIAARVKAALAAAGGREDTSGAAWIVQLGDGVLDPAVRQQVERGATVVVEARSTDPVQRDPRSFVIEGERVPLFRRVATPPGEVRWRDETGAPLMTEVRLGRGREWRLAFRLDPEWTDWTLRAAFPRWWAEQFATVETAGLALDPAQVTPAFVSASPPVDPYLPPAPRRVAGWLWLLAVGLLAVERWVSWREARRHSA